MSGLARMHEHAWLARNATLRSSLWLTLSSSIMAQLMWFKELNETHITILNMLLSNFSIDTLIKSNSIIKIAHQLFVEMPCLICVWLVTFDNLVPYPSKLHISQMLHFWELNTHWQSCRVFLKLSKHIRFSSIG